MKRRMNRAVNNRGPRRASSRDRHAGRRRLDRQRRKSTLWIERLEGRQVLAVAAPTFSLAADNGSLPTDKITNSGAVDVSGIVAGATWQYSTNSGVTWSADQTETTTSFSLAEGAYAIGAVQVRQTLASETSDPVTQNDAEFLIDTTVPTTNVSNIALSPDTGSNPSDGVTNNGSQTITATLSAALAVASGSASAEELWASTDNGGSWTNISSSVTGTSVSWSTTLSGSGTILMEVRDAAGNAAPQSTGRSYVIDTVAPTVLILSVGGTDSKVTSTVSDNTVEGTAEPYRTVSVFSSSTFLGTTTAGPDGVFSYPLTLANLVIIGQGSGKQVTASQTDLAGNTGTSAAFTFSVDTVAPQVTILSIGGADDTVSSLLADRTVVGQGVASLLVTIFSGVDVLGQAAADASGSFTYTLTAANLVTIGQGAGKSITASQTDTLGKTGTSAPRPFAVDSVQPTIAIASTTSTPLAIGATAALTFTLSEDSTTFTSGSISVTGGTLSNFSGSGKAYTATFTPPAGYTGPVTVSVPAGKFTDAAGNPNAAGNDLSLQVDTQPPAAPSTPDLVAADDSGASATDNVTNVTQPYFTGTADLGVTVSLWAKDPNGVEWEVGRGTATADTGSWTIQASGVGANSFSFTSGVWEVRARATDAAGNPGPISTPLSVTIVAATVLTPTIALDSSSDSGVFNNDGVTNVTTPTFLGTATPGTKVEVFRLPQSAVVPQSIGTVIADKDGNWRMPFGTAVVPFTDGFYTITATAADSAGNVSAEATLGTGLTVDTARPQLLLQPDGLKRGAADANQPVPSVDVTFGEEVFGLVAADFSLTLTANGITRTISLSGTATVLPASGGLSDDNWVVGNLASLTGASGDYTFALNQARVAQGKSLATDRAGNLLVYSSTSASWTTDTTAPTVTSMTATPSGSPATTLSPWNMGVSSVEIVFDEDVTGVDANDFSLVRDGTTVSLATATPAVTVTGSNKSWRLNNLGSLTTTDGNYTLTLKAAGSGIVDKAGTGNPLIVDSATSWRIDTTKPTATFAAVASPRATAVDSITLTFGEAVTGVQLGDFTLGRTVSGATTTVALASVTLSSGAGPASTYVLSGLAALTAADGTYSLSFDKDAGTKVTDAAGNQMAANPTARTWTVDTTKPTATITQPTPTLRSTAVTTVNVTFSTGVGGVGPEDFQLTRNGVVVPLTGVSITANSATSYTLTIPSAATTPDGAYALKLVAAGSGIAATAAPNNPLVADAPTTWTMDATPPSVVLSVIQRAGTKATVRALFSETVTDFFATDTVNDVTISGGTIGNPRNGTLVGREYLFDVTPTPANPILPVTITVKAGAASDAAGNANTVSAALRIVNDTTPPTVVLTAPAFTNQSPFTVTATFSEPVSGLTTAGVDFDATKATVSTPVMSGTSGTTWTIAVTPTAAGAVIIALKAGAAKDGSDNLSLASNTVRVTYDNVAPTVTLASLSGNPSRANTILVAATFIEDVTGVTAGDLTVTSGNATVVGVTGSGRNYTFQVRPGADGTIGLRMPINAATDAAGNGNTVSNTLSVTSDRTPPTVVSMTAPVNGNVTITFSEEVRAFDIRDLLLSRNGQTLSLTGATLTGPSGTNNTTWTLALGSLVSVGGPYRLQIAASSAGIVDLAGNPLADDRASPTTTLIRNFTIDTSPPVATFEAMQPFTNAAVATIGLSFNKPVTGVDLADLVLFRDGAVVGPGRLNNLTGVSLTPTSGSSAAYTISGLYAHTGVEGRYVIQLVATGSGITDASGNSLAAAATATWTLDKTPPTVTLGPVTSFVSGPISAVAVMFSEVVRGVDVADFTLTRDGTTVPLAGATLVVTTSAASNFQLAKLSSLTAVPGTYTLTLRATGTGIVDAAGNPLAADASATWQNVGAPVPGSLVGAFAAVVPNPRTVPVSTVSLNFTAAVTGVGPEDFRLTRTVGGSTTVVSTTGLTVTGSGVTRTVGGLTTLTQAAGDYVLRLVASGSGIVTSTGVALQSDVVASWRMVATPAAPTATIALDPPISFGAAPDSATITFTKDVTGVKLSAFVLTRGTVAVSLTGTALTALSPTIYRITGLAPIVAAVTSYELKLVAAGSGIVGIDGSTLQTDASATWTQTLASVRAAFLGIDRVTTAPVAAAKLRFSESVRGVDVTDFELTVDRNDGLGPQAVALRGVTVSGSGTSWTVGNLGGLQAGPGKYSLTLKKSNGDIVTAVGTPLAEDAVVEWTVA